MNTSMAFSDNRGQTGCTWTYLCNKESNLPQTSNWQAVMCVNLMLRVVSLRWKTTPVPFLVLFGARKIWASTGLAQVYLHSLDLTGSSTKSISNKIHPPACFFLSRVLMSWTQASAKWQSRKWVETPSSPYKRFWLISMLSGLVGRQKESLETLSSRSNKTSFNG